jgi:hypothetical protein
MGSRANALADQFEQALASFAKAVQDHPDEKWSATTEEGWTAAALAQHVSGQFPLEMEYITAAAEGKASPAYSWDDINGKNDGRAAANSTATKDQVLAELRDSGGSVASYIRGLSDEQLDATLSLPLAGGADVSTEQLLLGGVLIDHVNGHLKNLQAVA